MTTVRLRGIVPPRFKNLEDALLFLECVREKKQFPPEKWVWPYQVTNGISHTTKGYNDAPYELGFYIQESDKIVGGELVER